MVEASTPIVRKDRVKYVNALVRMGLFAGFRAYGALLSLTTGLAVSETIELHCDSAQGHEHGNARV